MEIRVEVVEPRKLAAVRRRVPVGAVAAAWRPALDQVWSFLRSQPALRTDGHNIFLYEYVGPGEPMNVDFGVEVTQSFTPAGEVYAAATPAGEAAMAVHRGGYDQLRRTHEALHRWAQANGRSFAAHSWEIYGDWSEDPSTLETTVVYLLA